MNSSQKNRIQLTKIQKLIGKRMQSSKATKPCFYIEAKADVTELMLLRPKLRKTLGIKITTNAFYIRALALAIQKYPLMVGRINGDNIKIANAINVGFAVNAPQGLVVPVIKQADKKTLAEIAHMEKILTDKARSNRLTIEDIEGETVAMSNLGVYGIDSFIGIIPSHASTILAIGNAIRTVIPNNGKPAMRKMVSLSLAVDQRIITNQYAAKFLNFISQQLSNHQQLV